MKLLIAALVLVVSLAADDQPVQPEKWQNPATWQQIKSGQTPAQVRKILGEPAGTESTKTIEILYYGDIPKKENGKTVRPEHGCLMFRRTPTEHILQKWIEPNWQGLPTWEQLQADYKQAIDDQRAAEIAERKRIAEEAAAERQRKIDEQTKQQQQRVQIQTKPKAPPINEGGNTVAPTRNKPQESSWLLDNILIIGCSSGFVILLMVFVYKQ